MKICLVTAFPPSREALNEYGFHIARELQLTPGLDLTILADDYFGSEPELEGFSVILCWQFNSLRNPARLLQAIRKVQPDVVWFNLGFASFGGKPLPAFVGIIIPAMVRLAGFHTHVTLHQLMETVDLNDAGIRFPVLYKGAGFIATQLLLFSNSVSVLLPAYRSLIREKYGRGSVHLRHHGILSGTPEYPDFSKRGNPEHRLLAFGKWGTYKRLEPMIQAFEKVRHRVPSVQLVIAGTDHPKAPGYLEAIAERCRDIPQIKFAGYIPENKIADLFQSASIAVMPYTSSAGSSGVAHLACAYGVPIVASDIQDVRQLADQEGLAIEFYRTGDVDSLASTLIELLEDRERQPEMAIQNFSAALRMSMPEIIRQYLRTFDLHRHLDLLLSVSRLRRLPRWLPMRERLLRAATRRRLAQLSASTTGSTQLPDLRHHTRQSNMAISNDTTPEENVSSSWSSRLEDRAGRIHSPTPANGKYHYVEPAHIYSETEAIPVLESGQKFKSNGKGDIRGVTPWNANRQPEDDRNPAGETRATDINRNPE